MILKNKKNIGYIILLVIVLGGSIWAGIKFLKPTNKNNQTSGSNLNQGRRFQGQGNFNRANFPRIHGTISSINGSTIVLKADDGNNKNIICSSSTRIIKQENGQMSQLTISDLKMGDEINVMSSATDGQSDIQARAIIVGKFQPPQDRGSSSSTNINNNSAVPDDSSLTQI